MVDLTPENFNRLAEDVTALGNNVTALDKTLGELKGSIEGLKHAHNVLTASAGIVGALFLRRWFMWAPRSVGWTTVLTV